MKKFESELVRICHALAENKYVTSHGGNVSCKRTDDSIYITPTKVSKGSLTTDDIIHVNIDSGDVIQIPHNNMNNKPTSELPFHLHLYKKRKDINCIIHAHPPVLTGFAIARTTILQKPFLPEVAFEIGSVRNIKYAEPGSDELAKEFDNEIDKGNAFLMENHGITIVGTNGLTRCFELLEMLEAQAKSIVVANTINVPCSIPSDGLDGLNRVIKKRKLNLPCAPNYADDLKKLFDL